MAKSNKLQVRHCAAAMSLLILGLLARPSIGVEFEPLERQQGAMMQRSPADIAAMASDCLEKWAYQEKTFNEEALDAAFGVCLGDAMAVFEDESRALEDALTPLASEEGRGLNCTLPTWGCRATTRCPELGSVRIKCVIDYCGTGTCPSCPKFLGNIAIKSWCSYKCKLDGEIVGSALEFNAYFKYFGPYCLGK
jgi:hypothetical protein